MWFERRKALSLLLLYVFVSVVGTGAFFIPIALVHYITSLDT